MAQVAAEPDSGGYTNLLAGQLVGGAVDAGIDRITLHRVTEAGGQYEAALLHFADSGHLAYRLEPIENGGVNFVPVDESVTEALVARAHPDWFDQVV